MDNSTEQTSQTQRENGAAPFSIVDLINAAGIDSVKVQFLGASMAGITSSKKHGDSTVSFHTDQLTPNDVAFNTGNVGVVVWIPRENFKKAQAASKAPPPYRPIELFLSTMNSILAEDLRAGRNGTVADLIDRTNAAIEGRAL